MRCNCLSSGSLVKYICPLFLVKCRLIEIQIINQKYFNPSALHRRAWNKINYAHLILDKGARKSLGWLCMIWWISTIWIICWRRGIHISIQVVPHLRDFHYHGYKLHYCLGPLLVMGRGDFCFWVDCYSYPQRRHGWQGPQGLGLAYILGFNTLL